MVQGSARERARIRRIEEFVTPGCLLHASGPGAWARLRSDVGLRQRQSRCGVLRRNDGQIQFPMQSRLRGCEQASSALAAPHFRGSVQSDLTTERLLKYKGEGIDMATMRVAQVTGAKKAFEIVERPIPQPTPGTVRIKVAACGVC